MGYAEYPWYDRRTNKLEKNGGNVIGNMGRDMSGAIDGAMDGDTDGAIDGDTLEAFARRRIREARQLAGNN